VAAWAFSYEFLARSDVSDAVFDAECYKVDLSVDTGNVKMDKWFRENFSPHTGQWIHNHPELKKLQKYLGIEPNKENWTCPHT
jgi:hypothetical protein